MEGTSFDFVCGLYDFVSVCLGIFGNFDELFDGAVFCVDLWICAGLEIGSCVGRMYNFFDDLCNL